MKAWQIIIVLIIISMSIFSIFRNKINSSTDSTPKEVFVLYQRTESLFKVARAITQDNVTFDLYLYNVDTSKPEDAHQVFTSVEHLNKQDLESKKSDLLKSYTWKPFKGQDVLFVQIKPNAFKDEMELLDKRQDIEVEIDKILTSKRIGDWMAGDLGPGGGNILYNVSNIDKSKSLILNTLKQNNLENKTLIGKRTMVDSGDWFYEVIYPLDYSGEFNTM